jgi:hypothetical protein
MNGLKLDIAICWHKISSSRLVFKKRNIQETQHPTSGTIKKSEHDERDKDRLASGIEAHMGFKRIYGEIYGERQSKRGAYGDRNEVRRGMRPARELYVAVLSSTPPTRKFRDPSPFEVKTLLQVAATSIQEKLKSHPRAMSSSRRSLGMFC